MWTELYLMLSVIASLRNVQEAGLKSSPTAGLADIAADITIENVHIENEKPEL